MGILDTITGAAAGAMLKANALAEHEALKIALFGIPSDATVDTIQKWFRYYGIVPSVTHTALETGGLLAVIGIFFGLIYEIAMLEGGKLISTLKFHWVWTILTIVFIVAVWILFPGTVPSVVSWIYNAIGSVIMWLYNAVVPKSTQDFILSPVKSIEGFVDKSSTKPVETDPERMTLVNIQPASVKQIGYAGPTEKGGSFVPDATILNAMQAGVRFFTLQIDYLENTMNSKFDKVNVPTLLYRNDSNELVSTNGASIADIAKNLSIYAFNKDFPSYSEPLILYLHFVRTPNYITKPDEYMKFLASVAEALGPIQSLILHKNDTTDFSRQQNEHALVLTPLTLFEKKILIFTNADTSIFRNAEKLSMPKMPLTKDLDYMSCMRVYLEDAADNLGITGFASEQTAYAIVASYARLKAISGKARDDYAMRGKTRFVIAMPSTMDTPSQDDINTMLTTMGVNTVPMNLFGNTNADINKQLTTWAKKPFYRLKPVLLQSVKVAVAGYTPPPSAV